MIYLPFNCSCSNPIVNPSDWRSGGKQLLKKPWFIQYRFKDPIHSEQYPNGKLVVVKGMNKFKTLEERRAATEAILKNELYMLKVEGFNPITKEFRGTPSDLLDGVDENTPFCEAFEFALDCLDVSKNMIDDMKRVGSYFILSAKMESLHFLKIKDIRKKHIYAAMVRTAESKRYSANRFNKMRSYIIMIFKKLVDLDAIDINPALAIPKRKTVKRLREVLTEKELEKIKPYLKDNYYSFYRYLMVFFHSGARSTELVEVKAKDVNIPDQTFIITVRKGKDQREELRPINKNALPYWKEIKALATTPDHFLFSRGLVPGPVKIDAWQISKRWRVHVKEKLGINKDLYSLKHLHTIKVIESYSRNLAASINGHKSNAMNDQHYDVMKKQRELEAAKNIDIDL